MHGARSGREGFLPLPVDGFLPLMSSPVVMVESAERLSMSVHEVERLVTIRAIPQSNLIAVVALHADRATAAGIANTVAEVAVDATNRMNRTDVDVLDAELKTMVDTAAERLKVAEQAREDYRKGCPARSAGTGGRDTPGATHRPDVAQRAARSRARPVRAGRARGRTPRACEVASAVRRGRRSRDARRQWRSTGASKRDPRFPWDAPRGAQRGIGADSKKRRWPSAHADVAALERRRAMLAQAAGSAGKDMARLNEALRRRGAVGAALRRVAARAAGLRRGLGEVPERAPFGAGANAAAARGRPGDCPRPAEGPVQPLRNVLLGFIAGTLLACGVVILHDALRAS